MRRGTVDHGRQRRTSPSSRRTRPRWWCRRPVTAPATGPAGPSAVLDGDGTFWLAYRLRRPLGAGRGLRQRRGPVGRRRPLRDGAVLDREEFGCDSLERPALVAVGRRDLAALRELRHAGDPATGGSTSSTPTTRPVRRRRRPAPCSRATRTVGVKDPVIKVDRRPVAHVAVLPSARPPRRHRPHVDPLRHQRRRARVGRCTAWPWPARPGPGTNGAPGWPTWSSGTAAGWPTTTAGPARRRTPRSAPASPSATPRVRWPPTEGCVGAVARRPGFAALPVGGGRCPTVGTRLFYETSRRDGAHDLRTEYVPPAR